MPAPLPQATTLRHCQRCQNTRFLRTSCPNPAEFGAKFFWSSSFATFLPRSARVLTGGSGRRAERGRGGLERGGVCAQPGKRGKQGKLVSRSKSESGVKRPTLRTSRISGTATGSVIPSVSSSALSGQRVLRESNTAGRAAARTGVSSSQGHRPPPPVPCTPTHTDCRRRGTVWAHA